MSGEKNRKARRRFRRSKAPATETTLTPARILQEAATAAPSPEEWEDLDIPPRGWPERGGGWAGPLAEPPRWLINSHTAAAWNPFTRQSTGPLAGIPLGFNLHDQKQVVCYDPLSWFRVNRQRAANQVILAGTALGKSTLIRRMILGYYLMGMSSVVAGDLKAEHIALVEALGGTVLRLGPGGGSVNLCDMISSLDMINLIPDQSAKESAMADFAASRLNTIAAILEINRGKRLSDVEAAMLGIALEERDRTSPEGTLTEVLNILRNPGPEVLADSGLDEAGWADYRGALAKTVWSVASDPVLSKIFNRPTTVNVDVRHGLVVDLSFIPQEATALTAQMMMATWSICMEAISLARLRSNSVFHVVVDELWRVMDATFSGRVDAALRLDRTLGFVTTMATHSAQDVRHRGSLLSRVAALHIGGQSRDDLAALDEVLHLQQVERDLLNSWMVGGTASGQVTGGAGKFMLHVGEGHIGVPYLVRLTEAEKAWSDTNQAMRGEAARPPLQPPTPPEAKRRRPVRKSHPVG